MHDIHRQKMLGVDDMQNTSLSVYKVLMESYFILFNPSLAASHPQRTVFVSLSGTKKQVMWNWVYRGLSHTYNPEEKEATQPHHHQSYFYQSYSMVQCFPLLSYLLVLNYTTPRLVDLLVLDTQGHEAEVLAAILDRPNLISIRVIVVQDRDKNIDVNKVRASGYVLLDSDVNHIFIKSNDESLQREAVKKRLTDKITLNDPPPS